MSGRRLHVLCEGSGAPTVVVIPALGSPLIEWIGIQRQLVPGVRVCLYDRGGLGWSDPVSGPRNLGVLADELHRLLNAADIPSPYVLVGHSIGGLIARLVATRHRDDVSGMVLVDPSHESMFDRFAEEFGLQERWSIERSAIRHRLKWLGFRRALLDMGARQGNRARMEYLCPPDLVECGLALTLTSRQRNADFAEMMGWRPGTRQVRQERVPLGHLPITIITRSADPTATSHGHWGGPEGKRREEIWQELQASLTALSDQTRQVISEKAGHNVQLDDPELVVREIRAMCERLRGD